MYTEWSTRRYYTQSVAGLILLILTIFKFHFFSLINYISYDLNFLKKILIFKKFYLLNTVHKLLYSVRIYLYILYLEVIINHSQTQG